MSKSHQNAGPRKPAGVKSILLLTMIGLVAMEGFSGLIILAAHHFLGTPKRISVFRFHPLLTGENVVQYETNWSETYPVFGYVNRVHISDECGYTTGRQGFIHNGDSARVIKPERFTIFILGGSTVAGHGSSCNDQTISAQLEKLLRKNYPDVDVVNAGVAGYYSPQEFLKLADDIMFYDPDIVITFSGINDFKYKMKEGGERPHTYFISGYHEMLYKTLEQTKSFWWSVKNLIYNSTRFTEYTYTRFVIQKGLSFLAGRTGSNSLSDLLTNTRRIVGVDRLPEKAVEYKDSGFEPELDKKVTYYSAYLRATKAITESLGAKYYFVLQPFLFTEQRELSKEEREALELTRYAFFKKTGEDYLKRAGYFWQRVDSQLKGTDINYHDFRGVFTGEAGVYSDYGHYTDHGDLKVAEGLYKILMEDHAIPDGLKIDTGGLPKVQ